LSTTENQPLEELRRILEAFDEQLRQERVRTETFRNRLNQQEAQIRELQKTTRGILESRIWKTLVRLDQQFSRWGTSSRDAATGSREIVQLCKEHPVDWSAPLSGKIRVYGWAVALSGILSVHVRLDDGEPVTATRGLPRPDVQAMFRRHAGAVNSGFRAIVDLAGLSEGAHLLSIQAVSNQGTTVEQAFPIQVQGVASESVTPSQPIPDKPTISVLTNGTNTRRSIESVLAQQYPHWELCGALDEYAAFDRRINAAPASGLKDALGIATGDFITVLGEDDEITPDALLAMAHSANQNPAADLIYSDEDRIDNDGVRTDAFHKPDWSPDHPLASLFTRHLGIYRASLARETGGFESEYDLALRFTARTHSVHHVPKVLYHWRTQESSILKASTPAAQRAIQYYAARS
jgi:hypothetical protein